MSNMWQKYFGWTRYITVEPTMWLYSMANQIIIIVQQDFYVYKSCRVEHGFPEEICNNLTANATVGAQVQVTVSDFIQWNSIVGQIFPVILAIFFGSWSDRRGRKAPLLIALFGKVIYAGMFVVNSMMDTWSLNMIMYTATIPMAILGSEVVIYACCFSYIADVSSNEHRTLRITILNVVYLTCSPVGIALGWFLFYNVVNLSYTAMFLIHGVLAVLAFVYSAIRLKSRTTPQQKPLEKGANPIRDFFDIKHVVESVTTLTKQRPRNGRLYLWILLLAMTLYAFEKSEKQMIYLYTQLKFSWSVWTFSQYRTYQTSLSVVAMLFGVPIMTKFVGMRDTMIVVVGTLSHAVGRTIFALAETPPLFYIGAAAAAFGPVTGTVVRSMSSKVIPAAERGKIFVILSVCDKAAPLFSGPIYTQLYKATINTAPSSIYWLTLTTQIAVLLLIMVIHVALGTKQMDNENQENPDLDPSIPPTKCLSEN